MPVLLSGARLPEAVPLPACCRCGCPGEALVARDVALCAPCYLDEQAITVDTGGPAQR